MNLVRNIALACIVSLLTCSCEMWRYIPPMQIQQVAFELPIVKRTVFSNGLVHFNYKNDSLPLVKVAVAFRIGTTSVPSEKAGSIFLLFSYLIDTRRDLIEEFDALGASPTFYVGTSGSRIDVTVSSTNAARALELLSRIIKEPIFNPDQFELLKRKYLSQLASAQQSPASLSSRFLYRSVYGIEHPLGTSQKDILNAAKSLQLEDLYHAYQAFVGPGSIAIITAGRISEIQSLVLCKKYFAQWYSNANSAPPLLAPLLRTGRAVWVVEQAGLRHIYFSLGGLGTPLGNPDEYAFRIASSLISAQAYRKLAAKGADCTRNPEVRLMYGTGHYSISCIIRTEEFSKSLETISDSMIYSSSFDDLDTKAVFDYKTQEIWKIVFSFESLEGLIDQILRLYWDRLPDNYYMESLYRLQNTSAAQVAAALEKYFRRDQIHVVFVGDSSLLHKVVPKKLGQVLHATP